MGMQLLYLIMAKSKIGDLVYKELLKDTPSDKLKTWNRLRGMMPFWAELHRKYGS
jgi:hypothetical protein